MSRQIRIVGLTIVAFGCLGWLSTASAETVESVEKKITEKWGAVKSISAKVKMEGAMSAMAGTGTWELEKRGDKIVFRMELSFGSQMSATTISDGEFTLSVTDQMGQKMAAKMKLDETQSMSPTAQLAKFRKTHELNVLPDQSVEGHAVYVIEGTPKQPTGYMGRMVSYYAKETGVPIRTTVHDANGNVTSNMTFTDIQINPEIDASRFEFKAPPGVEVVDMTKK